MYGFLHRHFKVLVIVAALGCAFAMGAVAAALIAQSDRTSSIENEAKQRRSATCETFEGVHRQEIERVRGTYAYLLAEPRAGWDSTHKFVFTVTLPQIEAEARSDQDQTGQFVPRYCDVPGIGLKEPDPEVPRRPRSLR